MDGAAVKECLEDLIAVHDRAPGDLKIASIEADGQTVTITTSEPSPAFINYLSDPYGCIIDMQVPEKDGIVVGTGPFIATKVTENEMDLVKNENYWGGDVKTDEVVVKSFVDGDTLTAALQTGELDATYGLPYASYPLFENNSAYAISYSETSRQFFGKMNYNRPIMQDEAVRKAITMGIDKEGFVDPDRLAEAVDEETTLISVMHVNNEVGSIQPLAAVAEKKKNALLHSDCVQSLGKLPIPTEVLDLASFSAHKIHGPKGMGALYKAGSLHIIPQQTGGGQEKGLRSGTENVPGIAGFGLAASMAAESMDERCTQIAAMRDYLRRGILDEIPDVRINTPDHDAVCCILNVSFLGTRGEVILHTLEQQGIYVSTGSACSSHAKTRGSHVLRAMGLSGEAIEGAIRFSLSAYNTKEDIEQTVDALKKAVHRFRHLGGFR